MRSECAIFDRGAEFPRASARRCLTFPHGVYSAHRFSSRSFSLRPDVRDLPTAPRLANSKLRLHGELPTHLQSLYGQCDPNFPTVLG